MNALISLIDHPTAGLLAWSLVHFLWQGALLALVLGAWLRWAPPATAATRYLAGVLTLAAMLVAPAATFLYLSSQSVAPAAASGPAAPRGPSRADSQVPGAALSPVTSQAAPDGSAAGARRSFQVFGAPLQVVVLAFWIAGVITLSFRLLGGWVVARRLATRATRPVAPEIHALARRVAGRLALDRLVHIVESSVVRVPVMVGWLKPVVLLPASAMSGLTPTQIEALLAHELAHIRRHDYIVNLMQSAVETLLFYHPGVWWVSRQIRAEREHCADDLAVAVCDRLVYVSALADLAQMTSTPRLALAATDGSLLRRVRRLLSVPSGDPMSGSSWLPVLIVVLLGGAVVPAVLASRGPAEEPGTAGQVAATTQGVGSGVAGGVPGGVVGGVSGGVVGGVPGGVVGGVPSGVGGGVPGGVIGGLPGGVIGGVPGGVVAFPEGEEPAAVQGESRQSEQAREAAEKLRQQLVELEKALSEMKDQRAVFDRVAATQQVDAQVADLKARIAGVEDQERRARQMYEQGLLSQSNVRELETKLQSLRQLLLRAQAERELRLADALLQGRDVEQLRDYQKLQREYEKTVSEYTQSLEKKRDEGADMRARELRAFMEELKARQDLTVTDDQRARKEIEELFRRQLTEGASAELLLRANQDRAYRDLAVVAGTIEITAPNEAIRAGDVLTIDIQNEPDLPRVYVVEPDGTVRLPLVGTVRVATLTTRQAREAVQKQLTDRRIEAREVTVGLRRSKEKDNEPKEPYGERQ